MRKRCLRRNRLRKVIVERGLIEPLEQLLRVLTVQEVRRIQAPEEPRILFGAHLPLFVEKTVETKVNDHAIYLVGVEISEEYFVGSVVGVD